MKVLRNILASLKHYYLYNFFGLGRILMGWIPKTRQNELRSLKNRHKGQRCFIIATGPSLNIDDVELLENEITFSLNSIFLIHDRTDWRSTYYVCTDTTHFMNMLKLYGDKINTVCKEEKFFNISSKKTAKDSGIQIDKAEYINISPINRLTDNGSNKFKFTTNVEKGIYSAGTVTNIAIIIAVYMGIRDIYLIGVDCDYSGKKKHVAKDFNDKAEKDPIIETRMKNGFRLIAPILKKRGINVYNATRGGKLEDFKRVDFDNIEL